MKVLKLIEWSQHYTLIFKTLKGSNSIVPGSILQNFKSIQDIMVVLLTCKNEEDSIELIQVL